MPNYGTTQCEGKTIILDDQADFTSRLMPYLPYQQAEEGDTYCFEMSAPGHDEAGNGCMVYWEFMAIKGEDRELDTYDYSTATRISWD